MHRPISAVLVWQYGITPKMAENDVNVEVGAQKMLDVKMTDVKLTDQFARHEIAGHEIEGRVCRA